MSYSEAMAKHYQENNKDKKEVNNMNDVQKQWLADFVDKMNADTEDKKVAKEAIEEKWIKDFVDSMSEEEAKKIARQAIIENWIKDFVDNMGEDDKEKR